MSRKGKKTTLAEIAKIIGGNEKKTSTTKWGKVTAVNTNTTTGEVESYTVQLDGASQTVTCKKLVGAKVNDIVQVTLSANGGTAVSGTVGGDTDAKDAVNNYFWHDTDGAHVSLLEKVVTGVKNVLINSTGMFIRNGTTELASFTADTVELGKNNDSAVMKFCDDVGRIDTFTSDDIKGIRVSSAEGFSRSLFWSDGDNNETIIEAGPEYSTTTSLPHARVYLLAPESGNSEVHIDADVVKVNNENVVAGCPFPVGFVVMTNASTNPNTTYSGTTWTSAGSSGSFYYWERTA